MIKPYRLYCQFCHFSRWEEKPVAEDLIVHPTAPVMTVTPKFDENRKLQPGKTIEQQQRYKCPNCGRLIKFKKHAKNIDTTSKTSPPKS